MSNYWLDKPEVNPIVDYDPKKHKFGGFVVWGGKTPERKLPDPEPFLEELSKLMEDPESAGNAKPLYDK